MVVERVTVIDGATNNTTTVAVGTEASRAVAVNPNTNQIYVVNLDSDNVTVIDGATNNTLPVAAGTNPIAVAVNPNTNQIYVANSNSNNVTVIDGNAPWSADFVVFDGDGAGNGPTITAGQSGTVTIGVDAARLVYQPDQLLLHRIACTGRLHVQPCLGHP